MTEQNSQLIVDPSVAEAILSLERRGRVAASKQRVRDIPTGGCISADEAIRRSELLRQPTMMGEGYGNNLLMDPPKYTVWTAPSEDVVPEVSTEDKRKKAAEKAAATREAKRKHAAFVKARVESGSTLFGQRVFLVPYTHDDWGERAERLGGLPEEMDIARTDFGHLILVPVIEETEAKEQGIRAKGFRDAEGRQFWVTAEYRTAIDNVFGRTQWERPLLPEEVAQFGVTIL